MLLRRKIFRCPLPIPFHVWGAEAIDLPEEANSLSRNLEATQQQGLSGLLGLAEDVKAYLQLLSSFLDQQNRFVKDQKLTREKVASASSSPPNPRLF